MFLWIFLFFMNLFIPIIMIFFGLMFSKTSPGEINNYFGYRTKMSMKNQDTWDFAHHYFGKLWYKYGIVTLIISTIVFLPFIGQNDDIVGIAGGIITFLQLIPIFIPIFFTEKALKSTFDKDGNKK